MPKKSKKDKKKKKQKKLKNLAVCDWAYDEDHLLALRKLYYCNGVSIVDDAEYDKLEVEHVNFGKCPKDSLLRQAGSDKKADYPEHVVALSVYLIFKYGSLPKKK